MGQRLHPHVASLLVALILSLPAEAARFHVTSAGDFSDLTPGDGICGDPLDPNGCSLRAALEESTALPGPDSVIIDQQVGAIFLTRGSLLIEGDGTTLGGYPDAVIDGLFNPYGTPSLIITADSCKLQMLTIRRSRGTAVVIAGAGNQIGGVVETERVVLIDNNVDPLPGGAILLTGEKAHGNSIGGCRIGLDAIGATIRPNQDGVIITDGAWGNRIGSTDLAYRNLISGNRGFGIRIEDGAHANVITANLIGLDISGYYPLGNDSGGILMATAYDNVIGGDTGAAINVISANGGPGVILRGSGTHGNGIIANSIGLDLSGRLPLPNNGAGVAIVENASNNVVRATGNGAPNIISGNNGDGVLIDGPGTTNNTIAGNWIGLDGYGNRPRSNGRVSGHGITISGGASHNQIGLPGSPNTIGGNNNYGILLSDPGTSDNTIAGNFIGASPSGSSGWGNGAGVVIENGASDNTIGGATEDERNVLGYNYGLDVPNGAGVIIRGAGTNANRIIGNHIGTDISGVWPLRNGIGVILVDGAQYNEIGGPNPGEGNVISANGISTYLNSIGRGIHISGPDTRFNRIIGNAIGLRGDRNTALGNFGHAIVLCGGASDNVIGTPAPGEGNLIAFNDGFGVFCFDQSTSRNSIRGNLWYANDSLGIANRDGSQQGLSAPTIILAGPNVVGGLAGSGTTVDLYIGSRDARGEIEGRIWLAEATAIPAGEFLFVNVGLNPGDTIVATGTTPEGSTSPFSLHAIVDQSTGTDNPRESGLPTRVVLYDGYPNPFNSSTRLRFDLPVRGHARLEIYNVLGQQVRVLTDSPHSAGTHEFDWDGRNAVGREAASGMYYAVLRAGDETRTRKLVLLK